MNLKLVILFALILFSSCATSQKNPTVQNNNPQQNLPNTSQAQSQQLISMARTSNLSYNRQIEPPDVSDIVGEMAKYEAEYNNIKSIENKILANPQAVQLCLLLDTSNSMDGLIEQAKSQLWEIVNELAKSKKNNKDIFFEVALYEYGNSRLESNTGYIRQVTSFTRDLDKLSELLFTLKTSGGDEYCGHVIASALNQLQWNPDSEALKIIYIAGNEPFSQGNINFKVSCKMSVQKDILINSIYCGNHDQGINTFWQLGANLSHGQYFSIDSDKITEVILTPFDDEIIKLNDENNKTYIYYGSEGMKSSKNQELQDSNAGSISKSNMTGRYISKSSRMYSNINWDLVDAADEKDFSIEKIDKKTLPDNLKDKSNEEIMKYVQEMKEKRLIIQKSIGELAVKRAEYIQSQKSKNPDDKSLGSVIIKSLRTQAENKNFTFK